jgi:DNA-binding transcriptional regulator YiaG
MEHPRLNSRLGVQTPHRDITKPVPAEMCVTARTRRIFGIVFIVESRTMPDLSQKAADDLPIISNDIETGRAEKLRNALGLLSPPDLASLLGVDERTLAAWRVQRRGPDFVKLGRSVFYRRPDVSKWIDLNVSPTDRAA